MLSSYTMHSIYTYTWSPTSDHPRFHFTKGDVGASSEDQEFSRVYLRHWASFLLNGLRVIFSTDCWENWLAVSTVCKWYGCLQKMLPLLRWFLFYWPYHPLNRWLNPKGLGFFPKSYHHWGPSIGGSLVILGAHPVKMFEACQIAGPWGYPPCKRLWCHGVLHSMEIWVYSELFALKISIRLKGAAYIDLVWIYPRRASSLSICPEKALQQRLASIFFHETTTWNLWMGPWGDWDVGSLGRFNTCMYLQHVVFILGSLLKRFGVVGFQGRRMFQSFWIKPTEVIFQFTKTFLGVKTGHVSKQDESFGCLFLVNSLHSQAIDFGDFLKKACSWT